MRMAIGRWGRPDPARSGRSGRPTAGSAMTGGDLSQPLAKPKGGAARAARPAAVRRFLDGGFRARKWSFFKPGADERGECAGQGGALHPQGARHGAGRIPSPLLLIAGDAAYRLRMRDRDRCRASRRGWCCSMTTGSIAGWASMRRASSPINMGSERGRPANPHGRAMRLQGDERPAYRHLSTPAATAGGHGGASTGGWRCPAITTMCAAASDAAAGALCGGDGRGAVQGFPLHGVARASASAIRLRADDEVDPPRSGTGSATARTPARRSASTSTRPRSVTSTRMRGGAGSTVRTLPMPRAAAMGWWAGTAGEGRCEGRADLARDLVRHRAEHHLQPAIGELEDATPRAEGAEGRLVGGGIVGQLHTQARGAGVDHADKFAASAQRRDEGVAATGGELSLRRRGRRSRGRGS